MPKLTDDPTEEEFIELAREAYRKTITESHRANIDLTAINMHPGEGPGTEDWSLSLAKMLLMTVHQYRQTLRELVKLAKK